MCERFHKPALHIGIRINGELHRRLSIPDRHDHSIRRNAFGNDHLDMAFDRLRDTEHSYIAAAHLRLNRYTRSFFAMVQPHTAKNGFACRDLYMERSVMSEKNRTILVVSRHDLAETSAHTQRVADLHCNIRFEIAFPRARNTRSRQERMPDNKTRLQLLVLIAVRAMIVIGERPEFVVFNKFLLCRSHFR